MLKLSFSGDSIAEINGSILAYAAALGNVRAGTSTPIGEPIADAPASPTPSAPTSPAPTEPAAPASPAANGEAKVDAAGTPFDPARHTGSIVKSGLWRLKAGVARGPGEGEDSPNYVAPGGSIPGTAAPATPPPAPAEPTPPPPPAAPAVDPNRPTTEGYTHDNGDGTEQWYINGAWDAGKHPIPGAAATTAEDDEFAAFRNAAAAAAPAEAGARSWTDADLSALCNQAAVASGAPEKVKVIITKFVGDEVAHSRNIPADKREEFALEVEAAFGITYAG